MASLCPSVHAEKSPVGAGSGTRWTPGCLGPVRSSWEAAALKAEGMARRTKPDGARVGDKARAALGQARLVYATRRPRGGGGVGVRCEQAGIELRCRLITRKAEGGVTMRAVAACPVGSRGGVQTGGRRTRHRRSDSPWAHHLVACARALGRDACRIEAGFIETRVWEQSRGPSQPPNASRGCGGARRRDESGWRHVRTLFQPYGPSTYSKPVLSSFRREIGRSGEASLREA